jgi:hypothetical protein
LFSSTLRARHRGRKVAQELFNLLHFSPQRRCVFAARLDLIEEYCYFVTMAFHCASNSASGPRCRKPFASTSSFIFTCFWLQGLPFVIPCPLLNQKHIQFVSNFSRQLKISTPKLERLFARSALRFVVSFSPFQRMFSHCKIELPFSDNARS